VAAGRILTWILASILVAAACPAFSATPDDVRCAAVKPGEKIEFRGRTLIETPDIAEPQLRLANALISDQCFDQAVQLIDQFVQANPDNDHVFFVKARLKWILFSQAQGRLVVDRALQLRPDFSSMKILLASMYLEEQNFPEASKLLDEVEKVHPEDLWLFMDRLRIEAGVAGSPATLETLTAVMADPHFPPSARGQAMKTAKYMDGITQEQRDRFFTSSMDAGVASDCDLAAQATDLIEFRHDPAAGVSLIEKYLHAGSKCHATPLVLAILAEGYLLEAAKIAPGPVAANAKLVREAKEAAGGNLNPVAQRVAGRPFLVAPLLPFLKGSTDVSEPDENGHSLICSAVISQNAAMVAAQLDAGADPNGRCGHESLVGTLLLTASWDKVAERQSILRSLLERGARVELLHSCADPTLGGDCRTTFYPILKEFDDRRAKTRESL